MQKLEFIIVGAAVLLLGGCKKTPEDEILAQYRRGEDAIAANNCTEYRNVITPDSVKRIEETLRLALEATEEQAKALEPSQLQHMIMFRNRISPEQLRRMSADDVLAWQMDKGYMIVDKDYGLVPESVRITGDSALIQMGTRVSRRSSVGFGRRGTRLAGAAISEALGGGTIVAIPGIAWHYQKVNGFWYADTAADEKVFNQDLIDSAKEERMSVQEYIMLGEEEEAGNVKKDIWTPPGKG